MTDNKKYIEVINYNCWQKKIGDIPNTIQDIMNIIFKLKEYNDNCLDIKKTKKEIDFSNLENIIFDFREHSTYPKVPKIEKMKEFKPKINKIIKPIEKAKYLKILNDENLENLVEIYDISKKFDKYIL